MRAPLISPWRLRREGVLGMNHRVRNYVLRYNPRKYLPNADNKALTATLASAHGVPTPVNHHVLRFNSEIRKVLLSTETLPGFVLKPVSGSMGNGIMLVASTERSSGRRPQLEFVLRDGKRLPMRNVSYHCAMILSGLFSLDGKPDQALVQEIIATHAKLAELSFGGVPDIRVILLRGVPVMAMLRLTTRESRGRANLHQGGIGVGIDLATGRTLHAMHRGRPVDTHPDSGVGLLGTVLPLWDQVLQLAAKAADMMKLGYLGMDVVIDSKRGPLLLEANARPGLAIQLASGSGLAARLHEVEAMRVLPESPEARVALGQSLFSVTEGAAP